VNSRPVIDRARVRAFHTIQPEDVARLRAVFPTLSLRKLIQLCVQDIDPDEVARLGAGLAGFGASMPARPRDTSSASPKQKPGARGSGQRLAVGYFFLRRVLALVGGSGASPLPGSPGSMNSGGRP